MSLAHAQYITILLARSHWCDGVHVIYQLHKLKLWESATPIIFNKINQTIQYTIIGVADTPHPSLKGTGVFIKEIPWLLQLYN